MQPSQQGQLYYAGPQQAQAFGMQQAPYSGAMPGQVYQAPLQAGRLAAAPGPAPHPGPTAPASGQIMRPAYAPAPGQSQQQQQQQRPTGRGPSSAPKTMRAQQLGGGPPPQMVYAGQAYAHPGMMLVQQPMVPPGAFPQYHQPLVHSPRPPPAHPYPVPQPRPSPPQRPQVQHQQQHAVQQQSAPQQQSSPQQQSAPQQQGVQPAQPQPPQQAGEGWAHTGAIMRPQQLPRGSSPPRPPMPSPGQQPQLQLHSPQQQHTPKIMRPMMHGQPAPQMHYPPPPTAGMLRPVVLPPGSLPATLSPPGQPYLMQPHMAASSPSASAMLVASSPQQLPLPSPPQRQLASPQQQRQPPHQQQPAGGPTHHAPLIVQGGSGARSGLGGAGGGPRAVLQAPGRRPQQRKRDYVPPVEKLTQDPVPRQPVNEAERKEVDEWIKERRKHFPSATNLAKKEAELKEQAARGELDLMREERRRRLHDILARQQSLGLAKAAGTLDMFFAMSRGGGRGGRGGRGRGGGRDGGGGRGARPFGYEAFMQAGDAPQHQYHPQHASGANSQPVQRQQQEQQQQHTPAGAEGEGAAAAGAAAGPHLGEKRGLEEGAEAGLPGKRPRVEASAGVEQREGDAASSAAATGGDAAAVNGHAPSSQQQQQRWEPRGGHQQGWEPRGRGGRGGRGRGRGGRDGGFQEGGRGWGRGRGRERGRGRGGRVSWQEPHPHSNHHHPQQQQPPQWRQPRPASPTLLQKLLAKEIRQDHSYLLQAFRFFVANNFLLDFAAGAKPLEFPHHVGAEAEAQRAQQPASLEDLLSNPELAVELEVSDEELDRASQPAPQQQQQQQPMEAPPQQEAGATGSEGGESEEEEEAAGEAVSSGDEGGDSGSEGEGMEVGGLSEVEEEGELPSGAEAQMGEEAGEVMNLAEADTGMEEELEFS